MFKRKWLAATVAVLVVGSAGLAGAAAGSSSTVESATQTDHTADASGSAYAGTHVSANVTADALVDYRVNGTTVAESVRVQSQSAVEANTELGLGGDLGAVTSFAGAGLSAGASTETSTTVTAESGASMTAHDNGHGTLVVAATGESQYVSMNLSSSSSARSESDSRVVVTQDDGTESAVLVAGNGSVTVNEDGNVTADLAEDSRLVVRTYDQRDETATQQEGMIINGTAAAQVYLTQQADTGGEAAADVVDYGQNASVSVTQRAEGNVEMTVERAQSQGKVVITSVSEETFDTAEDIRVRVDGNAAVEASSYSELAAAADGGQTSKFLVQGSATAQASADVAVALNHFSERTVTMTEDSGDTSDDSESGDTTTPDSDSTADSDAGGDTTEDTSGADDSTTTTPGSTGPGFTLVAALLAVAGALGIARRRS